MDQTSRRLSTRDRLIGLTMGLAVLSLLLNLFLLLQLRRPERWLAPAAARMTERLGDDATLNYDVRIRAGTPLRGDVPIDETFRIAVDTVIPLNTTVRVPFRSPFGSHSVDLPIRANIPIRANLPVQIRHTFRLDAATSEEIVIPIELRLSDLSLENVIE